MWLQKLSKSSASLVGRPIILFYSFILAFAAVEKFLHNSCAVILFDFLAIGEQPYTRVLYNNCLLYTSDAADE